MRKNQRTITITIDDVDTEGYAHVINAVWMLLMATPYEYGVQSDGSVPDAELDEIWDSYSEVSYEHGTRSGTAQYKAARSVRRRSTSRTETSG